MALVIEFKQKSREGAGSNFKATDGRFTLLFFTGVQYERIADKQPDSSKANRNLPRRRGQQLKA